MAILDWILILTYVYLTGIWTEVFVRSFLKTWHPSHGSKAPDVAAGLFLAVIWPITLLVYLIRGIGKSIERHINTGP